MKFNVDPKAEAWKIGLFAAAAAALYALAKRVEGTWVELLFFR